MLRALPNTHTGFKRVFEYEEKAASAYRKCKAGVKNVVVETRKAAAQCGLLYGAYIPRP